MTHRISRRRMIQGTAAAGFGILVVGRRVWGESTSPNEKLNIAIIGPGGQGGSNLNGVSSQNIVAICDVDDKRAGNAYERFPQAKKYYDFRKMLDEMDKQIDAVVVSTPDHTHFHAAMTAMTRGKHCYCEKPMAHSVWEIRTMTETAAEKKLATQLGVQRHTMDNMHRIVELIKSGAIGKVAEVHAWIGGDRGMPKVPTEFPPVPETLQWDLWLGPAAERPYSPAYCPYNWRFWWDFGTGEAGNWGCHILDIPFWALDLKYPTKVSASGPEVDPQRTSKSMHSTLLFPAEGDRPAVTLYWSHSKTGPDFLVEKKLWCPGSGVVFVGSEGMLVCDFGKRVLYPEEKFADFQAPEKSIPNSPGFHKEWINACKGGPAATCDFAYSGPLSETVLLANTAYRSGEAFDWDAATLKTGKPAADALIRPTFRKGWEWNG